MSWNRILSPILSIIILFTLSGCDQTMLSEPTPIALGQQSDFLVVGTATTPPFEFYNEDGDLVGFDIDLAYLLAEQMGQRIEWKVLAFADLLPALEAGDVDLVIAAMYITPEREKLVDFSLSYLETGLVMVVGEDADPINDPSNLEGLRVGVKIGATGERWIDGLVAEEGRNFELFRYQDTRDSLDDLRQGYLDVVLNDQINTLIYMHNYQGLKIGSDIIERANLGIAIREGNTEMLTQVNTCLENLKNSGELERLYERWIDA